MRRAVIALVIAAVAVEASAGPVDQLEKAKQSFRAKDWGSAKPLVNDLLYPRPQLASQADLIDAHVMLGVCYFHLGQREDAKAEFETVLTLDPDKTLDKLIYDEGAIRMFDETRAEIRDRLEREKERRELAEKAEAIRRYLEAQRLYEVHPFYINFLPFGAGQFQNRDTVKGYIVAGTQLTTLAASLGLWLYLTRRYPDGKVPLEEALDARRYQQIEFVAGAAFWGMYALSIFDAIRNYTPRTQLKADDSLLPPELKNAIKKPPPKSSWRLFPLPVPNGAGVGLSWESH